MIARIDNIWVPGAYRFDAEGFLVTRKTPTADAVRVTAYPYVPLAEAFQATDMPACCSCYVLNEGNYPWIRFANKLVMQESGLDVAVHWLHFELDLDKSTGGQKKVWPGVTCTGQTWQADAAATTLYMQVCQLIVPHGASHYMSRSGLHVIVPITPVPYAHFLAHAQHFLESVVVPHMRDVRKLLPLHLDLSCVEPSRLHYLPQICKPKQGHLRLPYYQGSGALHTLDAPAWLEKSSSGSIEPLQFNRKTRDEALRFMDRWLKSHTIWMETALPGAGRNARLYAFGGDIRQFEQAGLLSDAPKWLAFAVALGQNALGAPVHNAEAAVFNGYENGVGSDSIAALMLHISKQDNRLDARKNIEFALRARRTA